MKEAKKILEKIKIMLLDMGFEETVVTNPYRSFTNYVRGDLYCEPQYIERLGFLIEYAHSYEEAQKQWHEDGDSHPLQIGEEAILYGLEKEVRENMESHEGA